MMNVDTGHAHIMHQIAPLCEDFGAYWKYTHINDNDGLNDLHLAPGCGTLDIDAVAHAARRANYTGILTMEYEKPDLARRSGHGGRIWQGRLRTARLNDEILAKRP